MLAVFEHGFLPVLNAQARVFPLGAAAQESSLYGLLSSAVGYPRLITLKGDIKPRSWISSVDTVGTLAPLAHVWFEFTITFRFWTAAKRILRVLERACRFRGRVLIAYFRRGEIGMSGTRTLIAKQFTERRRIHEVSFCSDSRETSSNLPY